MDDVAPDALLVVMGKVREDPLRVSSVEFFIWLLSYEFSDTVVLFTRNKVVFAVSAKKKALLDQMKKPDDYSGPEVEIVQKDSKTDNLGDFIDNLLTTNITSGNNVAMFKKIDEEDGDLTKMLIERVKANNLKLTEMQEFMDRVNRVKIYEEIQNVKIAARFTEWSFKKLIGELEDCMQNDIKVKHRKIGGNFEKLLDSPEKMGSFMKQHGVTDSQLLEFPLPVLIQSGEHFNLNKF